MAKEQPSRKTTLSQQLDGAFGQNRQLLNEGNSEEASVGKCLREIRMQRGLSMRVLAEMSGLNINTLSLIENEHTSPSVSTLQQLAQSLQVSMTDFFQTNQGSKDLVYQKQGKRPRVPFEHGAMEDLSAGMSRFGAEPIIVTFEANAKSGKKTIVHTGREIVYCLEGHILYTVEGEKFLLEPGDSLIFEAYLPHQCENVDATPSRVLLVLCPMDERDRPRERHFPERLQNVKN
jgi:transcriptional regulator with XRE-family HTH domain